MNFADQQKKKAGERQKKEDRIMKELREKEKDIDIQLHVSSVELTCVFAANARAASEELVKAGAGRGLAEIFRMFCGDVVAATVTELSIKQEEENGRNH